MTTLRTRVRVGSDGNITVPLGPAEAGKEVEVTVAPAEGPELINGIPRDKWFEILERTAGSIPDFDVLDEAVIEPIPRLEDP